MDQKSNKIKRICAICSSTFLVYPCEENRRKHCSKKCHALSSFGKNGYWKNKKRPKEKMGNAIDTMFQKGLIPWNTGKKWDQVTKMKMRVAAKDKWTKENNPNWKGGVTVKNRGMRHSEEYRLWRRSVFERDGFKCQICGDDKGGNLNAHHIKEWANYPESRFSLDNGKTLCDLCHKNTENYGYLSIKKQAYVSRQD